MSAPVNVSGIERATRASKEDRSSVSVSVASVSVSVSAAGARNRKRLVIAAKTRVRPSTETSIPTYRSLSNRPGRNKAGSMRSGRFVAPTAKTIVRGSGAPPPSATHSSSSETS